jgi:chemotaxis protein MotB
MAMSMRIVKLMTTAGLLAALAGGLTGCQVNQDTYDNLLNAFNAQKVRNVELTDENKALAATIEDLRRSIGAGSNAAEDAISMNSRLRAELEAANRRILDLDGQLRNIDFKPVMTLDPATDSALAELARQFPDVLSYDSARGLLRFTSDVTFASGDYTLTPAGREAVRQFARILTTVPSAGQYDILVAGHTDTQRVRILAGRKFENNAELSAFRALSVREEMNRAGVEPWRTGAVAYGETRPAVANAANGNTPQNRRVEVYLTKGNYTGLKAAPVASVRPAAAPASGGGGAARPAAPAGGASQGSAPAGGGGSSAPTGGGGNDFEIAR